MAGGIFMPFCLYRKKQGGRIMSTVKEVSMENKMRTQHPDYKNRIVEGSYTKDDFLAIAKEL